MTESNHRSAHGDVSETAAGILDFWFGAAWRIGEFEESRDRDRLWWQPDPSVDAYIRSRFGEDYERAVVGGLDDWVAVPEGRLALILLLDQFSRHIHRDDPRAFAQDERAQLLCLTGLERGSNQALGLEQRVFFYMPLQHAEDPVLQSRSVQLFQSLLEDAPEERKPRFAQYLDFARRHRDVIDRFGRFPHRNQVLNRRSEPSEQRFLRVEGRGF